ncbi:MAG TPA: DUF4292 domain-containing protein [Flavobacteriales bacterium]|nr:DUF4292 domain-containing protein [Flavobacteriales bacterium]
MSAWGKALIALVLLATACKSGKPIVLRPNKDVPVRSAEKVVDRLLVVDTLSPRYYTAKASVEIAIGEEHKSFKAQVKSVRDSAAWISVVPALGIEVARVVLTPDSLKMLDKLHDKYFVGDSAASKKKFGLQPSLHLFQEALLGKAIGIDPEEKYRVDREDGYYVITSKERRRFVRAAEDMSPGDTLADDHDMRERRLERTLRRAEERAAHVFKYWVEPDSFRVARVQIVDLVHDQTADVRYEERGTIEQGQLPTRISITLSEPGRVASGTLQITRIDFDGPLQLNFKIPEKYEPMP